MAATDPTKGEIPSPPRGEEGIPHPAEHPRGLAQNRVLRRGPLDHRNERFVTPRPKVCLLCEKRPAAFRKYTCMDCRQRRRSDPEFRAEANKKYTAYYKQHVKAYDRIRYRDTNRSGRLRRAFGLTLEQYEAMLAAQGGGCAICGEPPKIVAKKYGTRKTLPVDHCHATKVVRGILCNHCNTGLGSFRDNPELLEKAIAYLRKAEGRQP